MLLQAEISQTSVSLQLLFHWLRPETFPQAEISQTSVSLQLLFHRLRPETFLQLQCFVCFKLFYYLKTFRRFYFFRS